MRIRPEDLDFWLKFLSERECKIQKATFVKYWWCRGGFYKLVIENRAGEQIDD